MPRPLARWLKTLTSRVTSPIRRDRPAPSRRRLGLESLEDRTTPAFHTWIGAAGGNWDVAANWDTNTVPTTGESGGTVVFLTANSTQNISGLTVDAVEFLGNDLTLTLTQTLGLDGSNTNFNQIGASAGNHNILTSNGSALNLTGSADPFFDAGSVLTIATPFTGTRGFTASNAGTIVLNSTTASTNTGTTTVNSGILELSGVGTLGNTNVVVAGTLRVNGSNNQIADAATVTVNTGGSVQAQGGANETVGGLSLMNNSVVNIAAGGAFGVAGGGTLAQSGASGQITGAGNFLLSGGTVTIGVASVNSLLTIATPISGDGGFTKTGLGRLHLTTTADSTYTGTSTIADGILRLDTTTANAGFGAGTSVVVGDNTGGAETAVLELERSAEINNTATLTINGDGRVQMTTGITEELATLALSGGILNIDNTSNFILLSGATAGATASGSQITGTGTLGLGAATTTFDVANGTAANDLTIATVISGVGGLTKTGAGTLQLTTTTPNTPDTYTGTTTIAEGVLFLDTNTPQAGLGAGTSVVVGDGTGAAESAVLRLNNDAEINDAVTLTINSDGKVEVPIGAVTEEVTNLVLNGGTLNIGSGSTFVLLSGATAGATTSGSQIVGGGTLGLGAATTTFVVADGSAANDLTISARVFGNNFGVTKTGAGTLVLSGLNAYNGATAVNAGTLVVNGRIDPSAVSVASGATLAGTSVVGNTTVNSGGTVAPAGAGAIDNLTTAALTLNGTYAADVSGANGDTITATSVNLTGASLNITSLATPTAQTFTLIDNSGGAVTGTFAGLAEGALMSIGGAQYRISYTGGTGNDVTLTRVVSLSVSDVSQAEGNAGSSPLAFTVTLSGASTSTVTVGFTTTGGTATAGVDYVPASGTLTFAPGETSKAVNVLVNGDTADEPTETFTLVLSGPTNAAIAAGGGTATATLVNDDAPPAPPGPAPTPPPPPPPFYSGATSFPGGVVLQGAGVAGGTVFVALPPGSSALFADINGDGQGDVTLVLPTLTVAVDGQTGRFLVLLADLNGDRVNDILLFNADGTRTLTDGRTGAQTPF